ncbi:ABC transporter ATP-binding protein [Aneurinibacillus danicus]|jgi:branched-chain amino acid transport system ATP-binding protein|uniref:ABC transporter ATP-binding protein n=1 Tax=Aneurinibacillus danicus TaxID=267746 RepID=A0A511V7Q6_9BACL|nr:ABC transporter ATP-binding protein [Aneurinibacillus danicus]
MKVLKLENIFASYGNIEALRNMSLEIPEGSIITLLGANGAGKTTTLKVISGVVKPKFGKLMYQGEELTGKSPDQIVKRKIIQCPENRQVFPQLTVLENLRIGSYARRDRAMVKEDLQKVLEMFPRLKERLAQFAGTLSGGEQQMLAIGRALMAAPKVLLLDEPSLGLAPIIVKEIFEIIKNINRTGTSILLVEQNAHLALSIADYAYVLENGQIALSGKATELKKDNRVRELYLGVTS